MDTTAGIQLCQLVLSKAGRDKDKAYLITKIADKYFVYLADGDRKTLVNPKRKNIKHIQITSRVATELKDKLLSGKRLENGEIKQAINELMG